MILDSANFYVKKKGVGEQIFETFVWREREGDVPMDLPRMTSPKMTCFPSRWAVAVQVIKNWEPLVLGPALALAQPDKKEG